MRKLFKPNAKPSDRLKRMLKRSAKQPPLLPLGASKRNMMQQTGARLKQTLRLAVPPALLRLPSPSVTLAARVQTSR